MFNIRPIQADEIAYFTSIGVSAEEAGAVQSYIERLLAHGSLRLEWCYVMEEEGHPIGRIAFWTMPTLEKPLMMVLLELPWEREDYLSVGTILLEKTMTIAQGYGADLMEYMLDSPPVAPHFQRYEEQRMNLLHHMDFHSTRNTNRFEWNGESQSILTSSHSLTFRTLPEVGDDAFIEAIQKVSAQTLDQRINEEREEACGAREHATLLFEELKEMEYAPDWWQLAYDEGEQLVGFVMPTKAPNFATIGYIGVVPEHRGHGYIDILLKQGTATLLQTGENLIRTDTDVSNFPMAQAFLRCGYTQFASRKEYSKKLGAK
ncbi:GNAT family N-acetyltransferase [Paenibacillus sp. N1-5-1-14]|uniref:GNAT family N-acetyltransferase n=1 Tax=Paenibacillus radicibacter TaxID=2972488 RepID=UPI002159610F|nr:GNAT family N-acetyltransferase [Paenibacillus radicibacter]MCR8644573.1 GNAT family N-acetyltransferase [Paenibacillus radicibacter]